MVREMLAARQRNLRAEPGGLENAAATAQDHRSPSPGPGRQQIEVWWYPPALFAERGIVDPLSLYLSLKAGHDERTEAALDEMMEKFRW